MSIHLGPPAPGDPVVSGRRPVPAGQRVVAGGRAAAGALAALCAVGVTLTMAAPALAHGSASDAAARRPAPAPSAAAPSAVLAAATRAGVTPVAAPSGSRTGTVVVSGLLNVRAAAGTAAAVRGRLANGTRVVISCAITGQRIRGTVRTSRQWDRLVSGGYVAHGYIRTSAPVSACGASAPVPTAVGTPRFITEAGPGARLGQRQYGVPASVTIAQAILESGWGRSGLAARDNNFFGIKCFGGPGPIAVGCHPYSTFECDKAGKCSGTSASFRTYAAAADSFRDHGRFLRDNSRYAKAFAYSHDPDRFLRQVWLAGYATDPAYVAKVGGLMKTYDLYRYDL